MRLPFFLSFMPIKPFVMTAVRPEADPGGFESFDKTVFVGQKSMYTDVEIAIAPSPTLCYD